MDQEEVLELLCRIAQGISEMFGDNCEALVHQMDGQHIKTVAIYNGHVSGRSVGSTLSIYGNDTAMNNSEDMNLELDYRNQMVAVPSGKQIKSSTFHVRGKDFHYAIGINFDVTLLGQMNHLLTALTQFEGNLMTSLSQGSQPSLEALFDACHEVVNKPIAKMHKADRLTLVRLLREKGAFQIQRSVPYVAERMGVSKYTIYNYLNELENADHEGGYAL
ncbi:MAG: transcriptional regulator [Oscillospiraceae bacterium]|nr:transcriptional regulator [Oscillospiraceae bacterium]